MSRGLVRRKDKEMAQAELEEILRAGFVGHFATADREGFPYVVPNLYVYEAGQILCHNTKLQGHFRQNVEANPQVCFEVTEIGQVFPYGASECDTSTSYRSVICYGKMQILEQATDKQRFFDLFMAKYANPDWDRPKSVYPRLEQVTVYSLQIEQMTGKKNPLPAFGQQWTAVNNTLSPRT